MSDVDDEINEEDEQASGQGRRKLSGKKLILLYVLPLLILLGAGGGAGYYFLLAGPDDAAEAAATEAAEAEIDPTKIVFYDLPDILVNLNSGGKQNNYLKVSIALELMSADDLPIVQAVLPRIIDSFQIYLRELRLEDLNGSAGPMRLKEELLSRINGSMGNSRINDILFKELLVQ